ncbi:MAG: carbonic anhydrase, partial [Desulfobulbaceae bacterium]|nr:carbonic anhydrase [Desulfobulbaceae bacterium]
PGAETGHIIARGIEENVWQAIEDLFMRSPVSRELVQSGRAKVVGAVYDVGTGSVARLPEEKTGEILARVEQDPRREIKAVAGEGEPHPAH